MDIDMYLTLGKATATAAIARAEKKNKTVFTKQNIIIANFFPKYFTTRCNYQSKT